MKQEIKEKIENLAANFSSMEHHEISGQLRQMLYEIELENTVNQEPIRISNLVSESVKLLQNDAPFKNMIHTGFDDFDRTCGGFGLGELIVLGARPAMGKTQLMVNLAINIAAKHSVLYLSYDLSGHQLSSRFISCVTQIPMQNMVQNQLTDEHMEQLKLVDQVFSNSNLYVNDSLGSSISAFTAYCEKQIKHDGIKVIFVDYLQMLSSYKHRYNREQEISSVCRALKNLAKEHNICVVASSQLSRAVDTRGGSRRPMLSDLRESGAIEQYADKVIFMYRPEYYGFMEDEEGFPTERRVDLIVSKNRNGFLGTAHILRNESFTTMKNYDGSVYDFSFNPSRLDVINEITPQMQMLIDKFGLSDTPF